MSDIPKHSFHITEDDIILINGIEIPQRNIFEFLESGRKQMQNNEKEINKLRKALERIAKAKECDVCKCQQVMGNTYDGEGFRQLQLVAKAAIK